MGETLENRPTKDEVAFERDCTHQGNVSNVEVDKIADNSIVNINVNIVVGDEVVPGPS